MPVRIVLLILVVALCAALPVPVSASSKNHALIRGGYFCENRGVPHPVLFVVAAIFNLPYGTAQGWYCDQEYNIWDIFLALTTNRLADGSPAPADILEMKRSMGSWEEVWRALGLIGEPEPPVQN